MGLTKLASLLLEVTPAFLRGVKRCDVGKKWVDVGKNYIHVGKHKKTAYTQKGAYRVLLNFFF
jgi:hypothetical protein